MKSAQDSPIKLQGNRSTAAEYGPIWVKLGMPAFKSADAARGWAKTILSKPQAMIDEVRLDGGISKDIEAYLGHPNEEEAIGLLNTCDQTWSSVQIPSPYISYLVKQGILDPTHALQGAAKKKSLIGTGALIWERICERATKDSLDEGLVYTPLLGAILNRRELLLSTAGSSEHQGGNKSLAKAIGPNPPYGPPCVEEAVERFRQWAGTQTRPEDFAMFVQETSGAWEHIIECTPVLRDAGGVLALRRMVHGRLCNALKNPHLSEDSFSCLTELAITHAVRTPERHNYATRDARQFFADLEKTGRKLTRAQIIELSVIADKPPEAAGGIETHNVLLGIAQIPDAVADEFILTKLLERRTLDRDQAILQSSRGKAIARALERMALEWGSAGIDRFADLLQGVDEWNMEGVTPGDFTNLGTHDNAEVRKAARMLAVKAGTSEPQVKRRTP